MRKPKQVNYRKHKKKNFNYLLEEFKRKKGSKLMNCTVRDKNGRSVIRNINEVTKPLIFADFTYLLPANQSLTDIDGQLEINGNIFLIEAKTHYNSINGGQLVSLFHNAYNAWKSGKIGQLTYRVSTGKTSPKGEPLFDYIVYGSKQFIQYRDGVAIEPHFELNKTNEWLAERLKQFYDACITTHDRDVQINNARLFSSITDIKLYLQNRGKTLGF